MTHWLSWHSDPMCSRIFQCMWLWDSVSPCRGLWRTPKDVCEHQMTLQGSCSSWMTSGVDQCWQFIIRKDHCVHVRVSMEQRNCVASIGGNCLPCSMDSITKISATWTEFSIVICNTNFSNFGALTCLHFLIPSSLVHVLRVSPLPQCIFLDQLRFSFWDTNSTGQGMRFSQSHASREWIGFEWVPSKGHNLDLSGQFQTSLAWMGQQTDLVCFRSFNRMSDQGGNWDLPLQSHLSGQKWLKSTSDLSPQWPSSSWTSNAFVWFTSSESPSGTNALLGWKQRHKQASPEQALATRLAIYRFIGKLERFDIDLSTHQSLMVHHNTFCWIVL